MGQIYFGGVGQNSIGVDSSSVRMSSASCSDIGQLVLGAWAIGLRTAPNRPISRLAKAFCSLYSDAVVSDPKVRMGCWPANALLTMSAPSPFRAGSRRIRSATPFVASNTAWK